MYSPSFKGCLRLKLRSSSSTASGVNVAYMLVRTAYIFTIWLSLFAAPKISWAQPSFTQNGASQLVSENCYRLTSDEVDQEVGSIWCEYPIRMENALELHFAVNFGCNRYAGEGLAFVFHQDKTGFDALGCAGKSLGFGKTKDCEGLAPSLAIELDSKYSPGIGDMYLPHMAVVQNGQQEFPIGSAKRLRSNGQSVVDCEYHDVTIRWSPSKQLLEVLFDGEIRLSLRKDLSQFFGMDQDVYFGFTASTGKKPNMQMVCVQSVSVSVDEVFEQKRSFQEGVGIYPNPIQEKLTIDLQLPEEQYIQMQLFDATGKLIYEIPTHSVRQNQYYFNLPGLPSGIYYISVTNGDHRVSKKIVHIATIRA